MPHQIYRTSCLTRLGYVTRRTTIHPLGFPYPASPTPYPSVMASYSSTTRANSNAGKTEPSRPSGQSGHLVFYRELVPAMIPIFILGPAVYIALHLTQTYLAHDKYVLEARGRIAELQNELEKLQFSGSCPRKSKIREEWHSKQCLRPPEIEPDGLLKMDVDQPVWQDANIADFPMGMFLIGWQMNLDIKYFLLIKLHYLNDIGLQWKADAVALPGADGGPEWDVMPQLPLLQKARSHTKTEDLVELVIINGLSDNASSDDDDGGELEEALSEVDAVVLNAPDHVDSWLHAA
ncbi:hypothetical protein BS47DRAFT_1487645 [Hydnum rufescens UP504]|uniref:Uncharacterized protein n=1 Tax=Hydnum rufescens UP504 TaxID=1448309 RepID=A0A9P6AQK9_9AGAM|nr:hypothetical protein BS47DRAFT_1487645 [Hydnum rufescens UP504]